MNGGRKFGSGGAVNDAGEIFLIGTVAGGGGERTWYFRRLGNKSPRVLTRLNPPLPHT
jgi:hypothetical protein